MDARKSAEAWLRQAGNLASSTERAANTVELMHWLWREERPTPRIALAANCRQSRQSVLAMCTKTALRRSAFFLATAGDKRKHSVEGQSLRAWPWRKQAVQWRARPWKSRAKMSWLPGRVLAARAALRRVRVTTGRRATQHISKCRTMNDTKRA